MQAQHLIQIPGILDGSFGSIALEKAERLGIPHRRIVERIVSGSQRKHGSCGENSRRDNKNAVAQPPSALGCPAMGAEVLEETEFDPFFTELESKMSGQSRAVP